MEFLLPVELTEFVQSLRKFLATNCGSQKIRQYLLPERQAWDQYQRGLWKELVNLGCLQGFLSEEQGGFGLGIIAAQVVIEETAKVLCPVPIFEAIALGALPLVIAGRGSKSNEYLLKIASGDFLVTGAFEAGYQGQKELIAVSRGLLAGTLELVPSVKQAQALLIPGVNGDNQIGLYLVDLNRNRDRFFIQSQQTFDLLRPYYSITFNNGSAVLLSEGNISKKTFNSLLSLISVLAVAELVGLGKTILEMTRNYVLTRKQFGREIGSFQVIQHKLADMYLALEQAGSLSRFAAWCFDQDTSQFPSASFAAKGFASEVIPELIETALQLHGGIAFTYEHDLHLYLRRAKVLSMCFGGSGECYEKLAKANCFGKSFC